MRATTRFRRPRWLAGVAAVALLASAAMSGTAFADSDSTTGSALGPVIDPDHQYADLLATRRPDGSWPGAAAPGTKATGAVAAPKLTLKELAALPRPAAADATSKASVTVVNVEGTKVETYLPAPGVKPEQLAASLRANGRPHARVVRAAETAPQLAPNDCRYGQARTVFECTLPVSYWRNNGYQDPLVRFNDHSSSAWPVTSAVSKWNQVPNIDSSYLWNSCPFMAGARCIDVISANYGGKEDWIGRAVVNYGANGGPIGEQNNVIQLNDFYPPNGFTRNMVATHEMGHALGLGHNQFSGDVMYASANTREDIGGENATLLANLYSIVR